ncbi:hypothetical protein [Saccharopolyspora hattusasensis]|uniref:hypothetical protein n=1 Tax=Saccharopolyspora hattusasensis TaxID=1128679 RepID=UPI003D968453
MSDQLTAWLRTIIPRRLVRTDRLTDQRRAPDWLTDPLGDAGPTLVVPLVLGAVYALLRKAEPHMSPMLT